MIKYLFIFFAFLFTLNASDLGKKTKLFEKYLNNELDLRILNEKQFYLIIDAKACKTCKLIDFDHLKKLNKRDDFNVIISYSRRGELPKSIKDIIKLENIFLDKGKYFKWNITPLSDGFIITKNRKIAKIYELELWSSETVNKLIKKNE